MLSVTLYTLLQMEWGHLSAAKKDFRDSIQYTVWQNTYNSTGLEKKTQADKD